MRLLSTTTTSSSHAMISKGEMQSRVGPTVTTVTTVTPVAYEHPTQVAAWLAGGDEHAAAVHARLFHRRASPPEGCLALTGRLQRLQRLQGLSRSLRSAAAVTAVTRAVSLSQVGCSGHSGYKGCFALTGRLQRSQRLQGLSRSHRCRPHLHIVASSHRGMATPWHGHTVPSSYHHSSVIKRPLCARSRSPTRHGARRRSRRRSRLRRRGASRQSSAPSCQRCVVNARAAGGSERERA